VKESHPFASLQKDLTKTHIFPSFYSGTTFDTFFLEERGGEEK